LSTYDLKKPHAKKSKGIKSGQCGVHCLDKALTVCQKRFYQGISIKYSHNKEAKSYC